METKYNEATNQRPEGHRPLSAAVMHVDLVARAAQLKSEPKFDKQEKNAITIFKNELLTQTLIVLKPGASIYPGTFEKNTTFTFLLITGEMEIKSGDDFFQLIPQQMIVLNHPHEFNIQAKAESICLLTASSWY